MPKNDSLRTYSENSVNCTADLLFDWFGFDQIGCVCARDSNQGSQAFVSTSLSHYFQVELTKPEVCEKEVWELLSECWNRDEKSRPNFCEISLFLKRKTISFDKELA